ncbi:MULTISPECIES: MFS transporter [unclassified Microbacterium]|jgi:MFS family permease|uniref:MFS transporter n=1 Tax=unclassified Microbacterium TaxID=2609290 RepID=UPI000412E1FB|nr:MULTISPECIES: MFS transporter [unclassified Microbacterium]PQZ56015.1 MFS transporter [Microbacterium sp. MYb43]PQZ78533.1 MFS transporter [Microbacterium sp. MYb40]PRB22641.1 MFS transporter [Microbacterium sp. MYb54]PRB26788.1 MFS transporter [Microbacterium sp. MYb50]PRB68907.1 MFS transporter [Microbacterium sp. MYb24]
MIAAQLTARFPNGMMSLAILLHVEQQTGSYGFAGLVLAATSVGQAVAGPITSRWMGVWGMRRVITLTLSVCVVAVLCLATLPLDVPGYMAFGMVAGLSTPPIQAAVRTIYPKLVNSSNLTPLFSLDASLQEIIWVLAPVVITLVSTQIGTTEGLLLVAIVLVGGGAWFILSPEVGRVRIPRSRNALGKVVLKPPVLLATVIGFLLIGACSAVEVGVVATFEHGSLTAGLVLAVFSAGSLAGGLAFGHIPIGPWAMARRLLIVTIGLGLTMVMLNVFWLGGTLILAGIGIAPALAVLFAITSASVKFSETAEAFGWAGTGQLIGAAAGSAVAGFLVDVGDWRGAYLAATIFAAVGLLVSIVFVRSFPDLRHRDASPHPDTEPLAVTPS